MVGCDLMERIQSPILSFPGHFGFLSNFLWRAKSGMPHFPPFCRLPSLAVQKIFRLPLGYFCSHCLCFWYYIHEIIAKTQAVKIFFYTSSWEFYEAMAWSGGSLAWLFVCDVRDSKAWFWKWSSNIPNTSQKGCCFPQCFLDVTVKYHLCGFMAESSTLFLWFMRLFDISTTPHHFSNVAL